MATSVAIRDGLSSLSSEDFVAAALKFAEIDMDGSGTLDWLEFEHLMLGHGMSRGADLNARKLFEKSDINSDGAHRCSSLAATPSTLSLSACCRLGPSLEGFPPADLSS